MGTLVVPGFDPVALFASESALGTAPTPANVAAMAAYALPTRKMDLGPVQAPEVRAKQDRGLGRGMQDGFVSGRYAPVPWSVEQSLMTRSAVDADPRELALFKAAGLKKTTNGGVSCVFSPSATPEPSTDFVSATLWRLLGRSPGEMEMERLTGCLVESLRIEGGDKEVTLNWSGVGQQKTVGTALASITLASGVVTTLTVTAAESYALAPGYYICESEIILVSAPTYGGTSVTIARAQLGTTGVAHTAQPLYPYIPSGISYSGSPISEALTTNVTLDDDSTFRCLSWSIDIKTGLAPLPGETGSAYFQGVKATRYDVAPSFTFLLKGNDVRKFNKARERTSLAFSVSQGTSAGGIITIAFPYCELVAPKADDNANDTVTVQASLRVRDNGSGNNAFSITLQ